MRGKIRSKDANETEGSDAERLLLVDVAEARAVAATRQSDHSDDKDNEITVAWIYHDRATTGASESRMWLHATGFGLGLNMSCSGMTCTDNLF